MKTVLTLHSDVRQVSQTQCGCGHVFAGSEIPTAERSREHQGRTEHMRCAS